jgi:hypothetical protein
MSSAVTNLRRQFVQRRLWPVAILLVAALAAVPMLLGEDPTPPPAAPALPVTGNDVPDELAAQPIVAPAEARIARRKVLGAAKNPFGVPPQDTDTVTESTAGAPVVQQTGDALTPGGSSPSGSGSTPSADTPSSPTAPTTPATPAPKPKQYALHELTVRFGATDQTDTQSLKRLQPLPSADEPVLIYMGVLKDGKTAVFLVDQGVTPVGDGECRPTPEQCETIRLQAGETEFLDITDESGAVTGQYQLDLIKIHKSSTTSASKAKATSKAGERLLQARASAEGLTAYRWNAETGALEPRRSELRSVVGRATAALP